MNSDEIRKDLSLAAPVREIVLGLKERNALHSLSVRTIEEFITVDLDKIFYLRGYGRFYSRGCGKEIHQTLLQYQKALRSKFLNDEVIGSELSDKPPVSTDSEDISRNFENGYQQLSVRATNILNKLNVKTLNDLVALEAYIIIRQKNCGRKTLHEIESFRRKFPSKENLEKSTEQVSIPSFEQILKNCPAEEETLLRLPLFSSHTVPYGNSLTLEFHESYRANYNIDDLPLSVRAQNVLRRNSIVTIGDLLITHPFSILRCKNAGRKTLREIQNTVREIVLGEPLSQEDVETSAEHISTTSIGIDYSSFENMVASYLQSVLRKQRDVDIFLYRIGIKGGNKLTLEEIARRVDLTRERIRQILKKTTRKIAHQSRLKIVSSFFENVQKIIDLSGPVVSSSLLADELVNSFNWPKKPEIDTLGEILSLNKRINVDEESGIVFDAQSPCIRCERVITNVISILGGTSNEIKVVDLGYRLIKICGTDCENNRLIPNEFNVSFMDFLLHRTEKYIIEGDIVTTRENWKQKYAQNKRGVIISTLKEIGKPVHYSELADYIRNHNLMFKDITDRNVHVCLTNYADFILTEPGKYALSSWDIKPYKIGADAIIELLERHGEQMRGSQIISILTRDGHYKKGSLLAALSKHPRIIIVGENTYDLLERVEKSKIAQKADDLEIVLNDNT